MGGQALVEVGGAEGVALESKTKAIATGRLSMNFSRDFQVFWKSFHVVKSLHFLASEAGLTTVEVVVEALATHPAVLREFEAFISPHRLLHLSYRSLKFLLIAAAELFLGLKGCALFSFQRFLLFCRLEVGSKFNCFYLGHRLLNDLLLNDHTHLEHLSNLVLLAGLYLSEDSVAASRLRALSEDLLGH